MNKEFGTWTLLGSFRIKRRKWTIWEVVGLRYCGTGPNRGATIWGVTIPERQVIAIDSRIRGQHRRKIIAHEIGHALAGKKANQHRLMCPVLEQIVDLLPLLDL